MEKREELQEQADKLKRIRAGLGLSRKAFSEYIGIPLRNLEEWEAGRRKMPEYLLRMLIYYVKMIFIFMCRMELFLKMALVRVLH